MVSRTKDQNTYVHGSWNVICDVCGFKFKQEDIRTRWDNKKVCKDDWEIRHEQDFLKGVKDDPSVPFTRPDTEVTVVTTHGDEGANVVWQSTGENIHDWNTTLTASRDADIFSGTRDDIVLTIYKTAVGSAANSLVIQKFLGATIREIPGDVKAVVVIRWNGTLWEEVSYTTL